MKVVLDPRVNPRVKARLNRHSRELDTPKHAYSPASKGRGVKRVVLEGGIADLDIYRYLVGILTDM